MSLNVKIHAGVVFIFDRQTQQGQSGQGSPPLADVSPNMFKRLTPRAKQMIFLAAEEMKSQGEQSIRPTHLPPGLLHKGEGIGAQRTRPSCCQSALLLLRAQQFPEGPLFSGRGWRVFEQPADTRYTHLRPLCAAFLYHAWKRLDLLFFHEEAVHPWGRMKRKRVKADPRCHEFLRVE